MSRTETRPYIGGQAVIEGVMMRSPRSFSIVVRRKSGALAVRERPARLSPDAPADLATQKGLAGWPFFRGIFTLVEALKLGSEALRFSSELYEQDLEESSEDKKPPKSGGALMALALSMAALATREPEPSEPSGSPAPPDGARRVLSALTILFALGLFVVLPQAAAGLASRGLDLQLDVRSTTFQALTGAFKLAIVVGYLLLIRRIPEIRRVFQYHGAEHKTISTYEAGEALVVENARKKSTLHPRCGTTFLVMVALVSIFVFSAVAPFLPRLAVSGVAEHALLLALKLPFLPVIAGVTFEIQRVFARYCTTGPLRLVLWPGFLVQKITTIEPDDHQLEVALASLTTTLWRENAAAIAPTSVTKRTFVDFAALSADPGYGHAA